MALPATCNALLFSLFYAFYTLLGGCCQLVGACFLLAVRTQAAARCVYAGVGVRKI